ARRDATRHGEIGRRDEGLDLEQDRPRALERTRDGGSDLAPGTASEDLGRIGDALQTCPGHLEHTELVRRAKSVLDGAENAMRVVPVALELEDAIDEMLEHARARDRSVLRHVPDEYRRDAGRLGRPQQTRSGFAHLTD